ncbi:MAG: SDR family NAD(P)-dependent oxidoreductase [Candidatus Niyogibacteria bacterium]|nr:SDR family NAD(P)-dependent oxidoreductase [Candidatus Niyogibacteria bacterium]
MQKFVKAFKNKRILVTGGTGSIGSEIVRQLINFKPKTIRVFARSEYGHHRLRQELGSKYEPPVRFIIGDIRDRNRLKLAMENIDIVFHAAAMKHVDICDNDPFEAVATNILGTQNIIDIARAFNIEKVIVISTDKAVNPEGVLGASKLMAEKLVLNSYSYRGEGRTHYACVRFGNVMGSNGSILPLLKKQIATQDYVTVTEPEMTRFVMTISQAVNLVLNASLLAQEEEIFVFKMPAVRLEDLVNAAIKYYAPLYNKKPSEIKIKFIGARFGDKMHEKLLTDCEAEYVLENKDMYILPHKKNIQNYKKANPFGAVARSASLDFSSENAKKLTEKDIIKLIGDIDGSSK